MFKSHVHRVTSFSSDSEVWLIFFSQGEASVLRKFPVPGWYNIWRGARKTVLILCVINVHKNQI